MDSTETGEFLGPRVIEVTGYLDVAKVHLWNIRIDVVKASREEIEFYGLRSKAGSWEKIHRGIIEFLWFENLKKMLCSYFSELL